MGTTMIGPAGMEPGELGELHDYEMYEKHLGEQLQGFARLRRQVRWFPLFAVLTGVPVWIATQALFGAAVIVVWLIFWGATLYITAMRSWQYTGERKRIQGEIRQRQQRADPSRAAEVRLAD
jgi:hypothetical protein